MRSACAVLALQLRNMRRVAPFGCQVVGFAHASHGVARGHRPRAGARGQGLRAGAALSMLRWKYFVQSEDDAFVALIDAYTKATGVKVTVARESAGSHG